MNGEDKSELPVGRHHLSFAQTDGVAIVRPLPLVIWFYDRVPPAPKQHPFSRAQVLQALVQRIANEGLDLNAAFVDRSRHPPVVDDGTVNVVRDRPTKCVGRLELLTEGYTGPDITGGPRHRLFPKQQEVEELGLVLEPQVQREHEVLQGAQPRRAKLTGARPLPRVHQWPQTHVVLIALLKGAHRGADR